MIYLIYFPDVCCDRSSDLIAVRTTPDWLEPEFPQYHIRQHELAVPGDQCAAFGLVVDVASSTAARMIARQFVNFSKWSLRRQNKKNQNRGSIP